MSVGLTVAAYAPQQTTPIIYTNLANRNVLRDSEKMEILTYKQIWLIQGVAELS